MTWRVATDIGGTFTDLVLMDDKGEVRTGKVSSTPPDFQVGVLRLLAETGLQGMTQFIHGSTVVINALTERKGARTALLTTRGFRDVLEIGRANRPDLYNLAYRKPRPFVPRYLRYEVTERLDAQGRVVTLLVEDELEPVAEACRANGVEALAICFLHAYRNSAHEVQAGARLAQLLPGVSITLSHQVTREWREYERASSAVLNAYVQPVAERYLGLLEEGLARHEEAGAAPEGAGAASGGPTAARRYLMQSNGGITTFTRGRRLPIQLVESGPVGGVTGAAAVGALLGEGDVISLDIGGTTAKTSLVEGGRVKLTGDYRIEWTPSNAGYPIKVPTVDIVEIGAGGGSIAWIDEAGGLHVGPRSAGAVPGPAAYGQGGGEPTVTDANFLTGRLNPKFYLGGRLPVDLNAARRAMATVADRLGLGTEETALGILRLANARMAQAVRMVSVRRGYDPRRFNLIASGGGGPLHAASIAAGLGVRRVVIPNFPGHFSGWGMLLSSLRHDALRTWVAPLEQAGEGDLQPLMAEMERETLDALVTQGVAPESVQLRWQAELRYQGQEHAVPVDLPPLAGRIPAAEPPTGSPGSWAANRKEVRRRFDAAHEQAYGYRLESPVELVTLHLTGESLVSAPRVPRLPAHRGDAAPMQHRRVLFEEGWQETPIFRRTDLGAGWRGFGPLVIEEEASTTLVLPGQRLEVDSFGHLLIETEGAR